jgi:hypothetical protein
LVYEDPLLGALQELENAVDEPLDDSDPPADPGEDEPDATADEGSNGVAPPLSRSPRSGPPVAQVPRGQARRRTGSVKTTDFLVGLLAVVVLGLSALGLFWLFKTR